ncbi:MAG TPA: hypothetical protein VLR69_06015, partial [Thermoanaerobaculia bacterium]|nr:hypothetical protein [Thermoanaerobaculia bacterium]
RSQSEATLLALTGDATMKNVSVSNIQSGRDTNITIAEKIVDSMNRIERSDADPKLKEAMRDLVQQITGLANDKRLSQDSVKNVEDRLDKFTAEVAEVTKGEHDRPSYSVTAEGLTEAAKAVGEVAAPVIATVTKILGLLAVAV